MKTAKSKSTISLGYLLFPKIHHSLRKVTKLVKKSPNLVTLLSSGLRLSSRLSQLFESVSLGRFVNTRENFETTRSSLFVAANSNGFCRQREREKERKLSGPSFQLKASLFYYFVKIVHCSYSRPCLLLKYRPRFCQHYVFFSV